MRRRCQLAGKLARRRSVDYIEITTMLFDKFNCVALVKFIATIIRLFLDVHSDDIKARPLIARGTPAGFAVRIK